MDGYASFKISRKPSQVKSRIKQYSKSEFGDMEAVIRQPRKREIFISDMEEKQGLARVKQVNLGTKDLELVVPRTTQL